MIDSEEDLLVPTVAIAEAGRRLVDTCGVPRDAVADALMEFLQKANLAVHGAEPDEVLNALLRCKTTEDLSFVDAMLWASARSAGARSFELDDSAPAAGEEPVSSPRLGGSLDS